MNLWSNVSSKRGSALLIVLGMLSFMVVSAVGFSVYMRQGRLPSSYLRRNVASRYLVKAALANAIEELDSGWMSKYEIGEEDGTDDSDHENGRMFGIYNDPYPGCGTDNTSAKNAMNGGERVFRFYNENGEHEVDLDYNKNGDYWFHRVFCPFGPLPYPDSASEAEDKPPITVPTLTLEALAYLPPAIVDDVRKVSRLTRTATWRSLPFEAGRYAYTAVNVSDLFDINRLQANVPRDSGPNRVTLATLTSTDPTDPGAVDDGNAQAIDSIVESMPKQEIPFVSIADFNVSAAMGNGKDYAPIMQFFGQQNKAYSDIAKGQEAKAANAMFITDTWFPQTNTVDKTYSLADGSGQPFRDFTASSVLTVLGSGNADSEVAQLYQRNLGLAYACLYDYLDGDSVPISLAIPTTEAVPMVVGVSAPLGLAPTVGNIGTVEQGPYTVPGTDSDGNAVQVKMNRTAQRVGLTGLGTRLQLNVLLTYPFKRMQTSKRVKSGDYKVRAILKAYLAPDGMGCRPNDGGKLLYPLKNDVTAAMGQGWSVANGVATVLSDNFTSGQDVSDFNNDVKTTTDAVKPILLQFSQLGVQMPFFWTVTEAQDPSNPAGYTPTQAPRAPYKSLDGMKTATDVLRPLTAEGAVEPTWLTALANAQNTMDTALLSSPTGPNEFPGLTTSYRLYTAVWVQVLDKNGKVVDMAPATVADDEWNGRPSVGGAILERMDGSALGVPLLNFKASGNPLVFDSTLETTMTGPFSSFDGWQTLYAVDPRFNFAPEDWFSSSAAVVSANDWITAISPLLGDDGRDRDIFMFVSNQEYLQSIGELQFLPFLQDTNDSGVYVDGDYSANYDRKQFSDRPNATAVANFAHGDFIWRSYCAYKLNDSVSDLDYEYANPYTIVKGGQVTPFPIQSDVGGFKLNPYSDDNRVISAATVLTPYDYYVASTNTLANSLDGEARSRKADLMAGLTTLQQMKSTYSFGESSVAELTPDNQMDINDAIREAFSRAAQDGKSDWLSAWNDQTLMKWQENAQNMINDQNNQFLGITLPANSLFHGVDRKYLYSFWRECFDNRQQLFLIFVRAEPSSVGGGSAGNVSSAQLGGRAVALVWRDPQGPENGARPSGDGTITRSSFRSRYKDNHRPHRTRILFYHQFD